MNFYLSSLKVRVGSETLDMLTPPGVDRHLNSKKPKGRNIYFFGLLISDCGILKNPIFIIPVPPTTG
jgi:hypothetical protein